MTRSVFLDPDGTLGDEWMFVVVECATGIRYVHQFGGTLNREAGVEGYLIPVSGAAARKQLDAVFRRGLRGAGVRGAGSPLGARSLDDVAAAVRHVCVWTSGDDSAPAALLLDEDRLEDVDEGWIPVLHPDGPGVLLWPNSD